ncbi:hypothetical protein ACG0Z6_14040 [Roseateles sp. BYS180W]|uniref:DUF4124 domain-containing protein n=1 Tax=Roseateles rivi TaxID=3299028 RepID=A0ABW7FYF8_9BURK
MSYTANSLFRPRVLAGLVLLTAGAGLWWGWGPIAGNVEVVGKRWQRDIDIERLQLESASDWCTAMPPQARDVQRRRVPHPDTGTPTEHCRYQAPSWRIHYQASAEGPWTQSPRWPQPVLQGPGPDGLGAQRAAQRHEHYWLQLQSRSGTQWECALPQAQWQAISLGQRLHVQMDRHGVADCASVRAALH